MATLGNNDLLKGIPDIQDAFIVIVKTEWNSDIVDALEKGCLDIIQQANLRYEVLTVPGAMEIPFAIQAYTKVNPQKASAFIALGAVIKGDTPHFNYICDGVTQGVLHLNLSLDVPVIFGVLTVDNRQQAIDRIGGADGHKGEEAAISAIKMIAFNRGL